jgi:hypothetical protein
MNVILQKLRSEIDAKSLEAWGFQLLAANCHYQLRQSRYHANSLLCASVPLCEITASRSRQFPVH